MSPTATRLHKPLETGYAQSAHKLPPKMQEDSPHRRRSRSFVQRISPSNLLLLKASLLEGHAALAAYREWRPTLDLATITYGQQRLLPLLQRNLTRLGIEDPLIDRFRGLRRYFWVRNLKAMAFARDVFAALDRDDVPFIVLKGAALVACYLDDRSLRPMDDIDVLVPEERLADAIMVLTAMNLRPKGLSPRQLIDSKHWRSSLPGWPFAIEDQNFDLHWKALHLDRAPEADDRFWQARRKATLDGTAITVLDPADQLLQICAHAAQPAAAAAAEQWPADAALVIRGSADLCFERLVGESSQRGLSAIVAEAMAFLADELELPIPRTFISRLSAAAHWTERREMRFLAEGSSQDHPSRLLLAFQDFRRSRREVFSQPIARALPTFLKEWAGVARIGPALLIAAQAAAGSPSWLRRMFSAETATASCHS